MNIENMTNQELNELKLKIDSMILKKNSSSSLELFFKEQASLEILEIEESVHTHPLGHPHA